MASGLSLHLLFATMVNASTRTASFAIWAGLVIGPMAWAINTQLGQVLPDVACRSARNAPALISFALTVLAVAAAAAPWRASRLLKNARTRSFVGMLSSLMALLFAYALALQGLSSMMLTGCER